MAFHVKLSVAQTAVPAVEDKEFKSAVFNTSDNRIRKPGTYSMVIKYAQLMEWDKSPEWRKVEICFTSLDERTYTKLFFIPVRSNPEWMYNDRRWVFGREMNRLLTGLDIHVEKPEELNEVVHTLFSADSHTLMCPNLEGMVLNLTLGYTGKYAEYNAELKAYQIYNQDGTPDLTIGQTFPKWLDVSNYVKESGIKLSNLDILEASPVSDEPNYLKLAQLFPVVD